MALRIELDGYKPGIAKFLAQKWSGSSNIDMLIQRNQDGYYLSGLNQWSPEKNWHAVENMSVYNGQLTGQIGEWLVDSLLSQESQIRFLIQIRDKQNENYVDGGVVSIADSVLASTALNLQTALPNDEQTIAQPDPVSDSIIEEQTPLIEESSLDPESGTLAEPIEPELEIIPVEPVKSKSRLGLIVAIIIGCIVLIGLGIAAWYFLFPKNQSQPTPAVQISGQCSLNNASADDLTFIQQCLQTKPETDAIIQIITEAKKTEKCNIAQRLYANQAQTNSKIAMLYAKEYDEKYYEANNCFKADKETAIYWYETSLTNDANNTFVKDRLTELQK
ncbi:hypothetical protein GA0061081_10556 [Gilliamella bombicola]|uniref:Uncharacterized protein n=1 Tax=Gilliamella bombicola TaxID=1798182 RepID=A0A1C4BP98_9GAMM|nr:hypothetical protein [Gilliamella bombicola]SCC08544.1 hypothetical protein GA0061081_10556 [Gilliamella bombicola]